MQVLLKQNLKNYRKNSILHHKNPNNKGVDVATTRITGIGHRNRRSKGKTYKPKLYLFVEFILLVMIVFVISLLELKLLTVLSAVAAIYFFNVSCLPRYDKIMKRQ